VRAQFLHPNTCHLHTLRGRQRNGKVEGGRGEVEGGWGDGGGGGGRGAQSLHRNTGHMHILRQREMGRRGGDEAGNK
jgi:hypothetical protein